MGASWGPLRRFLGASWVLLKASWGPPGTETSVPIPPLAPFLELSWGLLGPSWGPFKPCWGAPGVFWICLVSLFGCLGAIFGAVVEQRQAEKAGTPKN
eukprot:7955038-Pyramimonas_sp.AAC.1